MSGSHVPEDEVHRLPDAQSTLVQMQTAMEVMREQMQKLHTEKEQYRQRAEEAEQKLAEKVREVERLRQQQGQAVAEKIVDVMENPGDIGLDKLPEYTAEDSAQTVDAWIKKVTGNAKLYAWTAEETHLAAIRALGGTARRWHDRQTGLMSWKMMREALKEAFGEQVGVSDNQDLMLCRKGMSDFDSGPSCKKENEDHLVSDLDNASAPSDEQLANPEGETRKDLIQKWIVSHIHSYQCKKTICRSNRCRKMKKAVAHARTCQRDSCAICTQLVLISRHHAKHCQKANCPVLFCFAIKKKIKQQRQKNSCDDELATVVNPRDIHGVEINIDGDPSQAT